MTQLNYDVEVLPGETLKLPESVVHRVGHVYPLEALKPRARASRDRSPSSVVSRSLDVCQSTHTATWVKQVAIAQLMFTRSRPSSLERGRCKIGPKLSSLPLVGCVSIHAHRCAG